MSLRLPSRPFLALAFLLVSGTAVLGAAWSQTRPDDPNSLASVAAELRLLRLSVEGSMRNQTEMNAMGVLLATVQSRITQLTSRLDGLRDEIRVAAEKSAASAQHISNFQAAIGRESDPNRRAEMLRSFSVDKAEADQLAAREMELRSREMQLTNDLRLEETRWAEFVAKLEQLTRR